jgi:hypothetical protein
VYPELDHLTAQQGGLLRAARPTEETREDFLALAGAHYDARKRRLLRDGHNLVDQKLHRPIAHFDWTIHYAFGPYRRYSDVAAKFPPDSSTADGGQSTVRKAVQSLASFLDLTLTPSRRKRTRQRD